MKSITDEEKSFANIIAAAENAKFERAHNAVSAYITDSENAILQEIAQRLDCSTSQAIRRAITVYAVLLGYENMGGEIECRPAREGMLFGGVKNLYLTREGIERRND